MADQDTVRDTAKAAPPPPPPVAREAPRAVTRSTDSIAAKRFGSDPARPLRYTGAFLWGTVAGAFNKMAEGGRRGVYLGAVVGAASYIAFPLIFGAAAAFSLWAVPALAVAGFIGGAGLGALAGTLTGGYKNVGRAYRREKYADDLAIKEEAKAQHRQRYASYRDRYDEHQRSTAFNFDRLMQLEQHRGGSWADKVSSEDRGGGRGV
jgi:hypothetical protein